MPTAEAPWALRIRDCNSHAVRGTGFLIAQGLAMTCWHVIQKKEGRRITACDRVEVDFAGPHERRTEARPVGTSPETIAADVAILELNEPGCAPTAPIGPIEPPLAGTPLAVFGFPAIPVPTSVPAVLRKNLLDPGIWAQVVVDGFDLRSEQLQLTSHNAHGAQIRRGFSGGPVVDPQTGLIAGMLTDASEAHRFSLMSPVRTLARCSPMLRKLLLSGMLSDPAFARGMKALTSRDYSGALADLRAVCARWPEDPDAWYYVALAALRGQRPRAHSTPYIDEIGRLLEQAASLPPRQPHVLALWALLKEDHHHAFGLDEGVPPAEKLRSATGSVNIEHALEICDHVPAPETPTWRELNRRRFH